MREQGPLATEKRQPRRRSLFRRALRRTFSALLLLAVLPFVLVPLYALINPPISAVMLWALLQGERAEAHWVPLSAMSPHLVRSVVASEDARFCTHHGIDWVEVRNALDTDDGRPRGASTITMQTVKNQFLWNRRSWLRKSLEAPLALYADLVLSKRRILEIYLNIVEWGPGVYGAEAAASHAFSTSADDLTQAQAARLAAILPAPRVRDAARPGPETARIAGRISQRAASAALDISCLAP